MSKFEGIYRLEVPELGINEVVTIRKEGRRVFRNGYSNWDGTKVVWGWMLETNELEADDDNYFHTYDANRKDVILEYKLRYANRNGKTFRLDKEPEHKLTKISEVK